MKKLHVLLPVAALPVWGRAPSRVCPERSQRVQAEQSSVRSFGPPHPVIPAESKDPYPDYGLIPAAREASDCLRLSMSFQPQMDEDGCLVVGRRGRFV